MWLKIETVRVPPDTHLAKVLDAGEVEAIQLAKGRPDDFILIDERRGRREAELLGLKTIGALGVLAEAHRLRLLADPLLELDKLRLHGFRVSARLIEEFRRLVSG